MWFILRITTTAATSMAARARGRRTVIPLVWVVVFFVVFVFPIFHQRRLLLTIQLKQCPLCLQQRTHIPRQFRARLLHRRHGRSRRSQGVAHLFVRGRGRQRRRGVALQKASALGGHLRQHRFDNGAFFVADGRGAVRVAVLLNEFAEKFIAGVGIGVFAAENVVGAAVGGWRRRRRRRGIRCFGFGRTRLGSGRRRAFQRGLLLLHGGVAH